VFWVTCGVLLELRGGASSTGGAQGGTTAAVRYRRAASLDPSLEGATLTDEGAQVRQYTTAVLTIAKTLLSCRLQTSGDARRLRWSSMSACGSTHTFEAAMAYAVQLHPLPAETVR
jgi:hypothetical protein